MKLLSRVDYSNCDILLEKPRFTIHNSRFTIPTFAAVARVRMKQTKDPQSCLLNEEAKRHTHSPQVET